MDPFASFWNDDIKIDRHVPAGTFGETSGEPVTERGFFDVGNTTTAAAEGDRVTRPGTVFLPETSADVPLESTLTCRDITVTVIEFRRFRAPRGLAGHLEMKVE